MSVTPVVNSGLGAWEAGPALEIRLDEDRAGAGADAFDGVGEGGMDLLGVAPIDHRGWDGEGRRHVGQAFGRQHRGRALAFLGVVLAEI